jgi:RNA polymerase sigma factor (sigma-70 family)
MQWHEAVALQLVQDGLPDAISQLSLRQRQVVIWRYYEQWSFEEIAERMGVCLSTARSTLRHALKNMRRNLVAENLSFD